MPADQLPNGMTLEQLRVAVESGPSVLGVVDRTTMLVVVSKAAENATLRTRIAELEAGLKPFAGMVTDGADQCSEHLLIRPSSEFFRGKPATLKDCFHAAALLARSTPTEADASGG